ncbi:hypothetical protein CLV86_0033 [Lacinutrix venerupis]|uniref:Uncharacterized protein n=1 Tax=Lacinutrix venerupis TaxID=1486034 RepID=A0AAC9PWW0_9FLAO|nr:hypothetical protein [Lacinutrix venerupis]APY00521.1 hypothetical protein BWR22_09385 [Lacinutrix venerupis]RLJ68647.1 hypothetical protein CLV86_0033 [Lacinutrix venerupis]
MIHTEKKENAAFIKESVNYLENLGFENIKADVEGYEAPKSYVKQDGDIKITPDITATRRTKKYYFEIGLKSDKPRLLKSKWRFLDVLSRMNDNRFRIITTRGHYKFTNDVLNDLNLNKTLIKI